jgi:hypothetical protein
VAAAYLGVQLANETVNRGEAFSYEELHSRIVDSLYTNIIRDKNNVIVKREGSKINEIALGLTTNKEIEAPQLTASERSKYRPFEAE